MEKLELEHLPCIRRVRFHKDGQYNQILVGLPDLANKNIVKLEL